MNNQNGPLQEEFKRKAGVVIRLIQASKNEPARLYFLKEIFNQYAEKIRYAPLENYLSFFFELDDYLNNAEWRRFKGEEKSKKSLIESFYSDVLRK